MTGAHPVDDSLDLPALRIPAEGFRVVGAFDFLHLASCILDDFLRLDDIAVAQPDFLPQDQTLVLAGRLLAEIRPVNIDFTTEQDLPVAK